jgi:hypothetical protein
MPYTINAFDDAEWKRHGLADFSEFADQITECNMGEDAFSGFGEWFFLPDEPLPNGDRVIYFGSWGNDNSPGASTYTNAEVFDALDPDQLIEFSKRVDHWESQPEYVESDDDYDSDGELAEDQILAQQELEDFEQADEYFGDYGDGEF